MRCGSATAAPRYGHISPFVRMTKIFSSWSAVVASERSFTDSSFLLGGAGHRAESKDYVERLVVNIVRFFERLFAAGRYDAVFCQTADSLFTHILFKVAQHFGAKLFAISPAWLQEGGRPGSFFTNDEFMRCDRMIAAYRALTARSLTPDEVARAEQFRQVVAGFDGNKAFYSVNKRSFGRNPLSPNVWRLPSYILANQRRNKDLDYTRIDPWAKARGNVLRLWRWWRSNSLIGSPDTIRVSAFAVSLFAARRRSARTRACSSVVLKGFVT